MLPENVPACPFCSTSAYQPGSSYMGGSLSQQGFTCEGCETFVQFYGHQGGVLLAFIDQNICDRIDADTDYPSWRFPEAFTTWVDKTLLPTWRHRVSKMEKLKDERWQQWLAEVFYVEYPELKGFVPPDYAERGSKSPFTDSYISYPSCPPDAKALYDSMFGEGRAVTAEAFGPLPPHLDGPVYPPKCPDVEGLSLWFYVEGRWEQVDPEVSATFKAPEDPILVNNREFFADVWVKLSGGIERPMPPVSETKNRYGGIEPWYTFQLRDAKITAGWRKRVVSISVETSTPFSAEDISRIASEDGVTFSMIGPSVMVGRISHRDEPRDPVDPSQVVHVNVHAWGKDKTVKYLTTLCRAVLLAQESA